MSADPYQILLEEHIIRKNAGLKTEHPLDMMYRIEAETSDALHGNADKYDNAESNDSENESDEDQ